jgi:RNA polymerase sigma-70 factor (ECF subfamily)
MKELESLIERWRSGDESAAARIYDRFRDRIFRLSYGLLGDAADAEEVAQDALLYALRHINRYDARRAKFSTWLHMITVSRCRDRQRRKRFSLSSLAAWLNRGPDEQSDEPGPEAQVARAESRNEVWQAIQGLSPVLREVIVLRHWGGYTYREIADIVGVPLGTAQSRVRLAYAQLEDSISDVGSPILRSEMR